MEQNQYSLFFKFYTFLANFIYITYSNLEYKITQVFFHRKNRLIKSSKSHYENSYQKYLKITTHVVKILTAFLLLISILVNVDLKSINDDIA